MWPKHLNTYLGNKGYTILKSELTPAQQTELKELLTVKPFIPPGAPKSMRTTFPVYRESSNKLYVPRYFGQDLFGPPKTYKISEGSDINLEFQGTLLEHQEPIIQKYIETVTANNGGGGLLELYCGWGKCLAIDTPILMYNGTIKKVQDINIGDILMGDDSTPRNVLSLARGREQMYKITHGENDSYTVNESHILSLKCVSDYDNYKQGDVIDLSVKEYIQLPKTFQDILFGYKVDVQFSKQHVDIEPYLLGVMLMKSNEMENRHIPNNYKFNDKQTRMKLLTGIIDSAGRNNGDHYEIYTDSVLSEDIVYLCRSLGFNCYKNESNKIICRMNDCLTSKIEVEKLHVDNYYGFCIDGNHRFVLGNFIVTHNTDSTIYTLCHLGKKTLIVVNKDFLANQWTERILKYCPTARIGRIQGQVIDIDDKDIVLCTIQSLSMKDYPSSLFDSFGFVIFDEVHHCSSEVFSRALFKISAKYMLGLSATVERKDKTSYVFKMFLGEVIAKQERSRDQNLVVRGIMYKTDDEEFLNVERDYKGDVCVSKMLSKICNFNRRSDFIIHVLKDMLVENPDQQIMMIASYKNILKYMFDAINHQNICSVGYYVGGMKQENLKESESKKVVLATYSMAAEGLDIKTLSTLFMITPMTNIEQSVGRILRKKHAFSAVVVDIIDPQENFQRQWAKRKTFYKKQNYKIIQKDSNKYSSSWKTVYEPTSHTIQEIEDDDDDDVNNDINTGICLIKR
jgi:superfamily II DNA or RNA helicase